MVFIMDCRFVYVVDINVEKGLFDFADEHELRAGAGGKIQVLQAEHWVGEVGTHG